MWEESERDEKRKWIRRVRQEIIPQTLEEEKDYKIEEREELDVEERYVEIEKEEGMVLEKK